MADQQHIRADSATSAVGAMMAAALPALEPPGHVRLRDGDRPFWDAIMLARARDEWNEHDLGLAAQLARCQADIERESKLLEAESCLIENARGTVVGNPRVQILELMTRRQMPLMHFLRLGGSAVGEARLEQGKRKLERDARRTRGELQDDELLAEA